jgi:uncharacterized protein
LTNELWFTIVIVLNHGSIERIASMPRKQKEGIVHQPPKIQGMKPIGVSTQILENVVLTVNEYEAIRLCDYEDLDHQMSAEKMNISRPTFTRLINKAHKKLAEAIVGVKDLIIEGGNYSFTNHLVRCFECGKVSTIEPTIVDDFDCPECKSINVVHLNKWFTNNQNRKRTGRGHGRRHRGNW